MKISKGIVGLLAMLIVLLSMQASAQSSGRKSFNDQWQFCLKDIKELPGSDAFMQQDWRSLSLPHDWSIELPFDKESPTGTGGGALRGGVGWYYKTFSLPASTKGKKVFIEFDGVYMNSEVFINGHSLGTRPNGYIGFRYDLTPYLVPGSQLNLLAVKVDNSRQPNSRWYSGSGIYRNVWLQISNPLYIEHWGTEIKAVAVSKVAAQVNVQTTLVNDGMAPVRYTVKTSIMDASGKLLQLQSAEKRLQAGLSEQVSQTMMMKNPRLWSTTDPYLYTVLTAVYVNGKQVETYKSPLGCRYFNFDIEKGFFLNDQPLKIRGVCNHHDLGCLGTAFNTRAAERQLQLLKEMGCNAIRTSHNPPAPELLDLCDKMGFLVMDEAFDMWKKEKNPYDYHIYWDQWHKRDLEDMVRRDRNHPSVIMWSVGNEIMEQWVRGDDTAKLMLQELYDIVKKLDNSRPVLTANNEPGPWNRLLRAGVNDMIGYNYAHARWDSVFLHWYRKPFIVTESTSALQTRGSYDMPSDSVRIWPSRWDKPLSDANADITCSAYDNCRTPWGSSHEASLQLLEKYPHISGMFIWTGFDYIGEPTPYPWPARSSYFGIIDLAGFPKDVYYLYQSTWTNKPVLHLYPHWNWRAGQAIDLWAYYNNADEVELFINGKSQGVRRKEGNAMHVVWKVIYEPGTIKAVSRKNGKTILIKEISTTGAPSRIILEADRRQLKAGNKDLSFVTVKICDEQGRVVPGATDKVSFRIQGDAGLAGTDNGLQTDLSSFQSAERKAWAGLCLAVVRSGKQKGTIKLVATAPGLKGAILEIVQQ